MAYGRNNPLRYLHYLLQGLPSVRISSCWVKYVLDNVTQFSQLSGYDNEFDTKVQVINRNNTSILLTKGEQQIWLM